ncbi:hypothetical protein [Knoellia sp. LjRoot47]|uniref:hypothetical protein n=1 Tax=Knoellia sp. LjRoot47 TaxID=3342330 RepID=UPI003ECD8B4E
MSSTTTRPRGRVSLTHGTIHGLVRANRRHRCDGHLIDPDDVHHIEPGEYYVASALPTHNPEIGNERWWHARYCLDCAPVQYAEAQR